VACVTDWAKGAIFACIRRGHGGIKDPEFLDGDGSGMAFVIISAGRLTHSRVLTVGVRPLICAVGAALLLLAATSMGLGYHVAQLQAAGVEAGSAMLALDPDQPEGRALLDQVGALSGRLSQLEGRAADLARTLGREPRGKLRHASTHAAPVGGPYLRATSSPLPGQSQLFTARGGHSGLALLEDWLSGLETTLDGLSGAAVAHDMEDMAFPYRLPMLGEEIEVSSAFGMRRDPFTGRPARHAGIDFPAAHGTPILASGGGRVIAAGYKGAYGRTVVIDHGDGLTTLYGHASRLLVRAGDIVLPQQPIALVGSTGRSSGPHLHFEVIREGVRVDPSRYLSQVIAPDRGR
jgi:murein DD-endopeptidase MepM/ murein hydrolase activator NlpD